MIRLTNTLSGRKESFEPVNDPVLMYVCGVTPYSRSHIGHALTFVHFDVIRRYLLFRGFGVRYAQNFTDIDDKIIARAASEARDPAALAAAEVAEFFADMDRLNILRADVYPRATRSVEGIVDATARLIASGHAYPLAGDVYFRVRAFDGYGRLSGRSLDDMRAGARVEVDERKEDPADFALWKGAKPGEPAWPSPWGPGRPGWHIECSVMCEAHLGPTVDIHGGGADLIFPHHENEIAQSEALLGRSPFARYWLHTGMLQLGGEKMSKSLGNLISIDEALARWSADAIRLFILGSNYRSPLSFSDEALGNAERSATRIRAAVRLADPGGFDDFDARAAHLRFVDAMDDDINAPAGVAIVLELVREVNRRAATGEAITGARALLERLARDVLGLSLEAPIEGGSGDDGLIQAMLDLRARFKADKNFAAADAIREALSAARIVVEDKAGGATWRRAPAG